jgi:proline iminopeptidase
LLGSADYNPFDNPHKGIEMSAKQIFQVRGFELEYTIEGTGQWTILVIGSARYYPRTFSAALRDVVRFVFIDHRGFGRATAPFTTADFELTELLADVEALRQHLRLDSVVILGHSGHGYLALE